MGHVMGRLAVLRGPSATARPSRIQTPLQIQALVLANEATTGRRLFTSLERGHVSQEDKSPKVHFHLNSICLYFTAATHLELLQQLFSCLARERRRFELNAKFITLMMRTPMMVTTK